MNKKKAIKIATATAIAASGFVAVAPSQSQAAANVSAEVSKAKKVMYDAMYTYSKPYVADGTLTSRTVVYAAYKKGEAQYKYAVNVLKYEKDAKKRAAYKADLDKVRNTYLLGRALNYIKTLNALELQVQPAAKKLDAVVASANVTEQQIKDAQAEFKKVYDAQQKDLAAVVESNIEATVKQAAKASYDKSNAAADKKAEEVAVPKVSSVSAINATQVEVKFNKELAGTDFDTQPEAAAIFKLTGETVSSAVLGADKKSVVVTFNSSIEATNSELIVEPVQTTKFDSNNQPVLTNKHAQVFTYTDTAKPEIATVTSSAKGNTATSVTVTTTEPIQSAVAKIDGTYVNVNFGGTNTSTITGVTLDATKEHTIELLNLTDKATVANVTVLSSKKFNVAIDGTAPTVSLSTASEKEIELSFNKRMDEATLEAAFAAGAGSGLVKDEALNNLQLASYGVPTGYVKEVAGSNGTKFTVAVSASLFGTKTTRNLTVLLPDTITDSLGNSTGTITKAVTLTKDVSKPVATGYRVVKDSQGRVTSIEVDFSEGLAGGTTPALPTIVNENGVAISAAVASGNFLDGLVPVVTTAGDKKVVYNATTPAKVAGKFAFSFNSLLVTDLAETPNTSDAFNRTIDFGSSTATFNLSSATAVNNVITVNFGTAVKGGAVANSATDVNNYTLGGKPLPANTNITLNSGQTQATINLPAGSIATTDGTTVFTVANVDSLTGAKLNAYNGTVATDDNVKPVLSSGSLTADNKLSLGFSEALTVTPDPADLVFKVNGSTVTQTGTTALTVTPGTGSDAGKYLVNLDGLVIQGSPVGAGTDTVLGTSDDVPATPTYFDVNNDGAFAAGTDIKIGDGPVAGFKFSSSALISSVTVSTLATGNSVGEDAKNNKLVNGTVVTVK